MYINTYGVYVHLIVAGAPKAGLRLFKAGPGEFGKDDGRAFGPKTASEVQNPHKVREWNHQ
jgi:hypothetical protein